MTDVRRAMLEVFKNEERINPDAKKYRVESWQKHLEALEEEAKRVEETRRKHEEERRKRARIQNLRGLNNFFND